MVRVRLIGTTWPMRRRCVTQRAHIIDRRRSVQSRAKSTTRGRQQSLFRQSRPAPASHGTRDTGLPPAYHLSSISFNYFSHSQFTYPLPTFSRHPTRHPPPARSFPPLSPLLPTQSPPSAFCIYRLPGCVYHSTPRRLNMVLINSAWFKSIKTSVTAS